MTLGVQQLAGAAWDEMHEKCAGAVLENLHRYTPKLRGSGRSYGAADRDRTYAAAPWSAGPDGAHKTRP